MLCSSESVSIVSAYLNNSTHDTSLPVVHFDVVILTAVSFSISKLIFHACFTHNLFICTYNTIQNSCSLYRSSELHFYPVNRNVYCIIIFNLNDFV